MAVILKIRTHANLTAGLLVGLILVASSGSHHWAQALEVVPGAKPEPDSVDRNYRDQLPRVKATKPLEAVAALTTRPGFRIELVASEPLVADPVSMTFDENGRLYVYEMPEYNQYANKAY